ncbi:hypothetical protein EJ04DRAFT_572589 [Polyplosphaeria fusca]|uniref:Tachykinin family protein n=1 Tax=Polyplosphaeria fusca TaxID=682080 RepID=A0A9P4R9S1_9PLEO|nr:hypothetical protein EJ04DRAFT_572589 [Polyplosphaeria fusca]
MSTKVQFINSTGNPKSPRKKRAQLKLVRSHVTGTRYREERERDIKSHTSSSRVQEVGSQDHAISNQDPRRPPRSKTAVEEDLEEANHVPSRRNIDPDVPLNHADPEHPPNNAIDELVLEQNGGHLIPLNFHLPRLFVDAGRGTTDPFSQMAPLPDPRLRKHFFYYVNVLMPRMHPSYTVNLVRKTFGCRGFMDADPLSLSAIAAFSATSRAMLAGDLVRTDVHPSSHNPGFHDSVYDWLYFKGKTIALVNQRLLQCSTALADTTLSAICDLILLETYTGDIPSATAHLTGLLHLSSLRPSLPLRLHSKLLASTTKFSCLTHTHPLLPFTLPHVLLPDIPHVLPRLGAALLARAEVAHIRPLLHSAVLTTRHTESVCAGTFPYAEDDAYFEAINDLNLSVEHGLLSLAPAASASDPEIGDGERRVSESIRLACLLYCNIVLVRGYTRSAAIVRNTVVRLRGEMQGGWGSWEGGREVLFWVLFMGLCGEEEEGEEFFTGGLREVGRELRLGSIEEAKCLLEGYLFVERVQGEVLGRVWTELAKEGF